jgi:hypothetical protein
MQINAAGENVRKVAIVAVNDTSVTVRALYGPLKGTTYEVAPSLLKGRGAGLMLPLGKRKDGSTVGPSPAQRGVNARRAARYPLRKVVEAGIGADPERPYADVDVLECGHVLSGASDMVGRRYPERRRCHRCEVRPCPHLWEEKYVVGGGTVEVCPVCGEQREPVPASKEQQS